MSEELGFETRLMQPPVLVPDIIGETFARDVVTVPVLRNLTIRSARL